MPLKKSYQQETYGSLRKKDGVDRDMSVNADRAISLAKLVASALTENIAMYMRRNKDGSVLIRLFDGDEKYEESLYGSDDWDLAIEEMVDALRGAQKVAWARRLFVATSQAASGGTKKQQP